MCNFYEKKKFKADESCCGSAITNEQFLLYRNTLGIKFIPDWLRESGSSTEFEHLENKDLATLLGSFYAEVHTTDQETYSTQVFIDIVFYNGRRGREGLRKLKLNSFEVKINDEGRKYIVITHNETKKKEQGDGTGGHGHNS